MTKRKGVVRRVAQSVPEFIKIIDSLSPTTSAGLWFRGQSNASDRLVPGALREIEPLTDGLGRLLKRGEMTRASGGEFTGPSTERMLAAFKRQARPFLDSVPTNDFEWMFVAQHHGLPTRLLDWSTNALVALFFAASKALSRTGDGKEPCKAFLIGDEFRDDGFAVFVIDPGALNEQSGKTPEPVDVAANPDKWSAYLDPMASGISPPICVVAPHISTSAISSSARDLGDKFYPFICRA